MCVCVLPHTCLQLSCLPSHIVANWSDFLPFFTFNFLKSSLLVLLYSPIIAQLIMDFFLGIFYFLFSCMMCMLVFMVVFYPLMGYAMKILGDNTVVPAENPY